MGRVVLLVLGMVLLVLGVQGGIRLLADHSAGILRWLPGGFAAQLGCFVVMALVGVTLAARCSVPNRGPDSGR